VFWRGPRLAVRDLAPQLKLRWRKRVQVRATMLTMDTQAYETIRLCGVKPAIAWQLGVPGQQSADRRQHAAGAAQAQPLVD
jgi:hypothetical protein